VKFRPKSGKNAFLIAFPIQKKREIGHNNKNSKLNISRRWL
jgi:hypothetical protein